MYRVRPLPLSRYRRTYKRKLGSFLLAGVLCFTQLGTISHAQTSSPSVRASSATSPLIVNQTPVNGIPMISSQAANPPQIISQAAVVMDMTTGTVVYAKNPLVLHYPASLTKILTALIALQKGSLTDELTVSKEAADQPPDKLYLIPGEKETLKQFLYALLVDSANDAAVVIAQHYGGSVQGFATMMNQEAKALGATHTHFVNPNGLPNPNHVTTAYDLAVISRAAMQNPIFRQIVSTKFYEWKGKAWHSDLMNINPMLFQYPGAIGIKNGFTDAAKQTLAVAATRGNQTFIVILLDAPLKSEIDDDATKLLNYAFANYQTETVVSAGSQVGTYALRSTVKPPSGGSTSTGTAAATSIPVGKTLPVVASRTVLATVKKGEQLNLQEQLTFHNNEGGTGNSLEPVGKLQLLNGAAPVASEPVLANLPALPTRPTSSPIRRILTIMGLLMAIAIAAGLLLRFLRRHRNDPKTRRNQIRLNRRDGRTGRNAQQFSGERWKNKWDQNP